MPRVRISSGVIRSSQATWVRVIGAKPPPGVGGLSGRCTSPERMMRVSLCTHGIDTSIWFHTIPSAPPGARMRSTSRPARSESTQCHDCANATMSYRSFGNPVCSATPSCHVTPSIGEAWARIASEGSTASTRRPERAKLSLILPRRVGTPSAPRGVDQRDHGLVRVGGAHGVVGTALPDEGVPIECA